MNRVLILGVSGFTGKHLQAFIDEFAPHDTYRFVGVDRVKDIVSNNIEFVCADLLEPGIIEDIFIKTKPESVINLAGIIHGNDFSEMYDANVGISWRILETAVRFRNVKKIVLVGSAAEYGVPETLPVTEDHNLRPVSLYGLTKVLQTNIALYYFRNYAVPVNIARTFNVIGENISSSLSIGAFLQRIKSTGTGGTIHTGNINTKRDYLCIQDAVEAYWLIMTRGNPGEVYNVCSGKSLLMRDILAHMISCSGKKLSLDVQEQYLRKNDVSDIMGDNARLIRDVDWKIRGNVFKEIEKMLLPQGD
jgi:GDP-4-dehydro-6-deoxy-D-mannose reductase